MGRFVKGSIVVVNYFFTDLSGSKRRPAVVIADLEGDDLMICPIVSSRSDRFRKSDKSGYFRGTVTAG